MAEGPDGFSASRVFLLAVRPARPAETTLSRRELALGASLELGADSHARFLPGFEGAFGLCSAGDPAEPWLTAYAVEFLVRARAAGVSVPEAAFGSTARWLAEFPDEPANELWPRAAQAYALYSLALAGRPRPGAARVLADQGAGRLPTLLARGLLGAALLRMGDAKRGEAQLREAVADPRREPFAQDYGSTVRDAAMLIVRARKRGEAADRMTRLIDLLPADAVNPARTSTQEQAWLIAAAAVLGRDGVPVPFAVDGQERAPAALTTVLRAPKGRPLSLRNLGQRPIFASVSLSGVPVQAPGAAREGLVVRRNFLNRNGTPVNLDALRRNDVFSLVIEGRAETRLAHQALLVHGLPAGWEAEPARLGPGEVPAFPFLSELTRARSVALRADRLVARIDLTREEPSFKLAFLVRAVTPGRFELPGAWPWRALRCRQSATAALSRVAARSPCRWPDCSSPGRALSARRRSKSSAPCSSRRTLARTRSSASGSPSRPMAAISKGFAQPIARSSAARRAPSMRANSPCLWPCRNGRAPFAQIATPSALRGRRRGYSPLLGRPVCSARPKQQESVPCKSSPRHARPCAAPGRSWG